MYYVSIVLAIVSIFLSVYVFISETKNLENLKNLELIQEIQHKLNNNIELTSEEREYLNSLRKEYGLD